MSRKHFSAQHINIYFQLTNAETCGIRLRSPLGDFNFIAVYRRPGFTEKIITGPIFSDNSLRPSELLLEILIHLILPGNALIPIGMALY